MSYHRAAHDRAHRIGGCVRHGVGGIRPQIAKLKIESEEDRSKAQAIATKLGDSPSDSKMHIANVSAKSSPSSETSPRHSRSSARSGRSSHERSKRLPAQAQDEAETLALSASDPFAELFARELADAHPGSGHWASNDEGSATHDGHAKNREDAKMRRKPITGTSMDNIRKSSRNEHRGLIAALAVLALAGAPVGVAAQTTADQVKDRETLKAFVVHAKQYLEGLTDFNDVMAFRDDCREHPTWLAGDVYLMNVHDDGSVGFHCADRAFQGKNVLDVRDDRGVAVVRQMMEAGENGGGFVDYVDGVLKTSYTVKTLTGVGNLSFYMIGGYSKDLSSAPETGMAIPTPEVTAADVVDTETLVAFVEAAADAYRRAYESDNPG